LYTFVRFLFLLKQISDAGKSEQRFVTCHVHLRTFVPVRV
jgi:S-adenosylmethionine:tRNA-ribosyltransferase-isomerase (queuine synthetase)